MKIINYRLLSFHEQYLPTARNYLRQVTGTRDTSGITLLFDSGAFTAWKRKEADIEVKVLAKTLRGAFKYCDEKFGGAFAISLDKIPGVPGTTPSHEEVREAIRISDENHRHLAGEFGNRILPVFHQGEPTERLHQVIDLNPEYICVSPRNDVHEKLRREWSQRTHSLIPKTTRTHGLATTGGSMMLEVDWYSVDSAAIIQAAAFGKVFIPHDNGNDLILISVSKQSPNRRHAGKHIDTMPEAVQATVERYMALYGISWEDMQTEGGAREVVNAAVLVEAAERRHKPTPVQQTFFAL